MSKVLYVGDPHVKVEDLADCQILLDFVLNLAVERQADRVVFLGDQHHNMAVVRVEVMDFWHRNLDLFRQHKIVVTMLTGNHDQSGDSSSKAHALVGYRSICQVIDEPTVVEGIVHIPYMHSASDFVEVCEEYSHCLVAVVHQEFNGALYENGFYSSTGADPLKIPQIQVLSGHIHTVQNFGKVSYLGSPRWLTVSDANEERFVTIIEHAEDGTEISRRLIPSPCQRIYRLSDNLDAPADNRGLDNRHRYVVDITGPQAWIEERRPLWLGKARVRTHRTDQQIIRLKESEGIEQALVKFAKEFIPPHGTSNEVLMGMVSRRLLEVV